MTSPVLDSTIHASARSHASVVPRRIEPATGRREQTARASGRDQKRSVARILFGLLDFPHQRQHVGAEVLDLLLEVQEAARIRSTPRLRYATIRSAICSGVPISWVRNPSLYCTRSSNEESAHMPFLSRWTLPACWTAPRKPSTAGSIGLRDDLAETVPRLLLGVPGDDEAVEPEPRTSRSDGAGVIAHLDDLLRDAVEVLAVREVPVRVAGRRCDARPSSCRPGRSPGAGRSGVLSGLGFSVKSWIR